MNKRKVRQCRSMLSSTSTWTWNAFQVTGWISSLVDQLQPSFLRKTYIKHFIKKAYGSTCKGQTGKASKQISFEINKVHGAMINALCVIIPSRKKLGKSTSIKGLNLYMSVSGNTVAQFIHVFYRGKNHSSCWNWTKM